MQQKSLKITAWTELLLGIGAAVCGAILGGVMLFPLAGCMLAFAVGCFAALAGKKPLTFSLGIPAGAVLVWGGLSSFFVLVRVSRYGMLTSPLSVMPVLVVLVLAQGALFVAFEGDAVLAGLRRESLFLAFLAVVALIALYVTYLKGLHYIECAIGCGMALSGGWMLLQAVLPKGDMFPPASPTSSASAFETKGTV